MASPVEFIGAPGNRYMRVKNNSGRIFDVKLPASTSEDYVASFPWHVHVCTAYTWSPRHGKGKKRVSMHQLLAADIAESLKF